MRDIHNLAAQLESALANLARSELSGVNKKLVRDFVDDGIAKGLSKGRLLKYLVVMTKVADLLGKDLDRAGKGDIQDVVRKIETSAYAEWTKHDYKAVLKMFYRWLRNCEEGFPEEVRWIRTTMKGSKTSKLPEELLVEEDILKMLDAAHHPRDKAFVHVLYESACRAGEILTLAIRNVQFDQYGAQIIVTGKTGMRRVRLVSSVPTLAAWLNAHPLRDNPSAALWIALATNMRSEPLGYRGAVKLVAETARRAGIKKRAHLHLFRHSRLTELAKAGVGESILKEFAGWTRGSDQPAVYIHLSGKNVDAALLRLNGIETPETETKSKLRPKHCVRCNTSNSANSRFCASCAAALDIVSALEIEEKVSEAYEVERKLDVNRLREELHELQERLMHLELASSPPARFRRQPVMRTQ